MTLLTAHKILISSAVACFAFYAGWEANHALSGADPGASWRALAAGVGALGLAVYLARVWRRG